MFAKGFWSWYHMTVADLGKYETLIRENAKDSPKIRRIACGLALVTSSTEHDHVRIKCRYTAEYH